MNISGDGEPLGASENRWESSKCSRFLAAALCAYALVGGGVTLAGWFGGWRHLTDWIGNGIAMFINAALAAICASLAILTLLVGGARSKTISRFLGALVAAIGGLTLIEHLTGLNLGIDTVFAVPAWGERAAASSGRMGPPASTCFALLGLALILARSRGRARRAVSFLGMIVIAVSLLGIIGYLFDANPLFAVARVTGVALQTATILLALGVALLASVPDLEPTATLCGNTAAGALVRRALPPMLLLPILLGWLFVIGRRGEMFDRGMGMALLVLASIALLSALVWWCVADVARHESASQAAALEVRRKNKELAALLESAARLAAIVEHSDDGICSTDLERTIKSWNRGAERLYGYTRSEALGQSLDIIIPEERRKQDLAVFERIGKGETVENYETERRRKNGTRVDVSLTVSTVKNADGQLIGVSKVARDITDRVRAKEKLERTVAERTASLQQALEQMEEFSYSVSHDLRAPLRAMSAYATVLIEDYGARLDETGRGFLVKIQRSSERMTRLTNDLLTYSRVARGQVRLEPIALEPLIHDIIHQYSTLQPEVADIEIGAPILSVLGHEPTLGQCVANLLNNAVKFVAPGVKPRVRIWTEALGKQVRIWFEDNGIGIQPEYQKRVFQMFERLHPEGTFEGTGIGLTIVRRAVEKMGGTVGIESDGVNGSRFWIELRRAAEAG